MNFISSIFSNQENALIATLLLFVFLTINLAILLAIYAYRAEKFERLFNVTNREAKILARLKSTYEQELKTFANLMDEITFPIWQRNKNGKIIYCNNRFCEVTNETRENIIRKDDVELFREAKFIAERALKTGQIQVIEQNIVINGNNALNQIVEIPVNDTNSEYGAKNGTIGFSLNFVELQNTRERLKLNIELQKRLLDSLNSAVAIYGINQKLEYYNSAFLDLWKFDEDWLKSYPSYGEILEALREKRKLPEQADFGSFKRDNLGYFNNLISKKEDYYYLADGRVLKVIIIPYQNRGLLFYYEDLTNQLSLERSYNTLVSVQKYTLDNLNESVAVFGEDGKLKLHNPNFASLWGFADSFLKSEPHVNNILQSMMPFFVADEYKNFKDEFLNLLNSRSYTEVKITRNDNKILLQRFTPLPSGSNLITFFDITDKEQVEKSLIAERRAYEEADKIKTNFLSNVSYELRSPLTSIMGFAEMMLLLYGKNLDEKTKEYTTAILDSSVKLKNLIDNIIDISSLDAGYVSLNINRATLQEITDDVFDFIKPLLEDKKVNFQTDVLVNIIALKADKNRLRQALKTFFEYIVLSSKEGDSISFVISKNNEKACFEILNQNLFISETESNSLFDKFYKLQSSSTHGGITMHIAKKIIELHNGKLEVISSEKLGVKFRIEI
jgi:signal transduction histidine kinase